MLNLLDVQAFMPHGHCYLWRPETLWLNVGSDALIVLAYSSIPISLIYFVRRRPDLSFNRMFGMFALFISLCGLTHVMSIVTTWFPQYNLEGLVKLGTGLVSIATAVSLWRWLPGALRLPTVRMLEDANRQLERARANLEFEVAERTAELCASRDQVRESEMIFRETFSLAPVGIARLDLSGRWLKVNPALCALTGYSEAELREKTFADITHPDDVRNDLEFVRRMASGEIKSYALEKRYLNKAGKVVWVGVTVAARPGSDGMPASYISCVQDITERHLMEQSLRESESRARAAAEMAETERLYLNAVLESAPCTVVLFDAKGKLLWLNAENINLWGRMPTIETVDDFNQWPGWWADSSARHGEKLSPYDWPAARAIEGETVSGDLISIEPFNAPGTRRTILQSAAPIRNPNNEIIGVVAMGKDITETVETKIALKRSEGTFKVLVDTIPQLTWMASGTGERFWFNQQWYDFTGLTREHSLGWGWKAAHHPDHLDRVMESLKFAMKSLQPWEETVPLRGRTGEWRWFLSRALPLKDERGHLIHWVGTNTDVTDSMVRNDIERRIAITETRLKAKSDSLAELSHELRTPLAAIRMAADFIPDGEDRETNFGQMIRDNCDHTLHLINNLLDVAKLDAGRLELNPEIVGLHDVISGSTEPLAILARRRQNALTVHIDENAPKQIVTDPLRLRQILTNLLSNAIKFTQGGQIHIDVRRARDMQLAITMSDTGAGISAEQRERIFQPFEQGGANISKSHGGTGLGLDLSRKLSRLLGGDLKLLESEPQCGSTFQVLIKLSLPVQPSFNQNDFEGRFLL